MRLVFRMSIFEFHYDVNETTTLDHVLAGGVLHESLSNYLEFQRVEDRPGETKALQILIDTVREEIIRLKDLIVLAINKGVLRLEYDISN